MDAAANGGVVAVEGDGAAAVSSVGSKDHALADDQYLLYIFSWSLTAIGQMVYFFRTYQKQTDGWEVPQTA